MSMAADELPVPPIPQRFRLAIALDNAGLTRDDMASYLAVDPTTVAKWLKGQRNPTRRTLILWAMKCGVPLAWLDPDDGPDKGGGQSVRVVESSPTQDIITSRCTALSAQRAESAQREALQRADLKRIIAEARVARPSTPVAS